jgi:hypothetical protein
MSEVRFRIQESCEHGITYFQVMSRTYDAYGECWEAMLAEADNRADAREHLRYFATLEEDRKRQERQT